MDPLVFGSILGGLGVLFGAFGAHALKDKMSDQLLVSFETGVRYQFFHALLLVLIGVAQRMNVLPMGLYTTLISLGVLLFSFSIYGLCLTSTFGTKWKWLGPITPLGGLLLLMGWFHLAWVAF
jgi:uncharacterized membrane protein YgdD (TMEM256/DUF423 family)